MRGRVLGVALVMALAGRLAAAADDATVERSRITAERAAAEQRFEAARRDCEQRFAVTTCLQDARIERRQVMDRLAREQAVLDDMQRRQRAAERLRGIQDKTRQADERSTPPPLRRVQRQPPLAPPRAVPPASAPPIIDSLAAEQDSASQAARNRRDHARRLQEAQAHRDAVRQRNAAREAKKPAAAPLPVPSAPTNGRR